MPALHAGLQWYILLCWHMAFSISACVVQGICTAVYIALQQSNVHMRNHA